MKQKTTETRKFRWPLHLDMAKASPAASGATRQELRAAAGLLPEAPKRQWGPVGTRGDQRKDR